MVKKRIKKNCLMCRYYAIYLEMKGQNCFNDDLSIEQGEECADNYTYWKREKLWTRIKYRKQIRERNELVSDLF